MNTAVMILEVKGDISDVEIMRSQIKRKYKDIITNSCLEFETSFEVIEKILR